MRRRHIDVERFEIVNPQLHLATLDSQDAQLAIEFNVEQGVGYQRATQLDDGASPPLGVLPLDAIFNPVRKVNYDVKRTRVGQVTDYERLELEVWTDGTIKPVEAVREAADHLVNPLLLVYELGPGRGGRGRAAAAVGVTGGVPDTDREIGVVAEDAELPEAGAYQ